MKLSEKVNGNNITPSEINQFSDEMMNQCVAYGIVPSQNNLEQLYATYLIASIMSNSYNEKPESQSNKYSIESKVGTTDTDTYIQKIHQKHIDKYRLHKIPDVLKLDHIESIVMNGETITLLTQLDVVKNKIFGYRETGAKALIKSYCTNNEYLLTEEFNKLEDTAEYILELIQNTISDAYTQQKSALIQETNNIRASNKEFYEELKSKLDDFDEMLRIRMSEILGNELYDGFTVKFRSIHRNTGNSTISVDGSDFIPIKSASGKHDILPDSIIPNYINELVYKYDVNPNNRYFQIVPNATKRTGFVTGDIHFCIKIDIDKTPPPYGWCYLGRTIGDSVSGADLSSEDCGDLFIYLYNNYDDTKCPVSNGRTGNAINDWKSHKKITVGAGRPYLLHNEINYDAMGVHYGQDMHSPISWLWHGHGFGAFGGILPIDGDPDDLVHRIVLAPQFATDPAIEFGNGHVGVMNGDHWIVQDNQAGSTMYVEPIGVGNTNFSLMQRAMVFCTLVKL